jgi:mRNA-degrading endonuclease toxin of MazEF toxin-antitoxin module
VEETLKGELIARVITNRSALVIDHRSPATLSPTSFLLEALSQTGTVHLHQTMAIPRNSLGAFLRQAKSSLKKAIDQKEKVTLVIGNESAGLLFLTFALEIHKTDTCFKILTLSQVRLYMHISSPSRIRQNLLPLCTYLY